MVDGTWTRRAIAACLFAAIGGPAVVMWRVFYYTHHGLACALAIIFSAIFIVFAGMFMDGEL